jgi:radical SAM-linked protein
MQEIICRFSKGEKVKWVSHLETLRVLERALRRAQLPVAYSQGFNPRARLALGPALPAGMTSDAELVAVFFERKLEAEELKARLNAQLPPAFHIHTAWAIPPYKKKQTLGDIDTAEYEVRVKGPVGAEELERRIVGLLSQETIPLTRQREKKTQQIDLRPLILGLSASEGEGSALIKMTLRTGSSGGARPLEVLEQLGIALGPEWEVICHRIGLYAGPTQLENRPPTKSPGLGRLQGRSFGQRRKPS